MRLERCTEHRNRKSDKEPSAVTPRKYRRQVAFDDTGDKIEVIFSIKRRTENRSEKIKNFSNHTDKTDKNGLPKEKKTFNDWR